MRRILLRAWRISGSLLLILAICGVFAYTLGKLSEGVGDILVVEGGPLDPTTRRPITAPVRVAIGGKLAYGLRWHYVEGGCSSRVFADFVQIADADGHPVADRARVGYERISAPRAVGQPGYDPIERGLPPGIFPGLWHYSVRIGDIQCPTRRPRDIPFVELDVQVFDPHAPIVAVHSLALTTPTVRLGGKLSYRISFTRRLPVSGVSIATYIADPPSQIPGKPDVVVTQRPIAYSEAKTYQDVDVTLPLPPEIWPGRWKLKIATLQNIPGGQQVDPVGDVAFEVVP